MTEVASRQMQMVPCEKCGTPNFVPANLEQFKPMACQECQHPVIAPVRLRQFELRSVIGAGGMAMVYRAIDTVLEREVAVKLMAVEIADDPVAMEGFYREARFQANLNHQNIIHIYNYDEDQGRKYLVMEVADRGDLDERIETHGRVDELYVLDVGIKMASALEALRKQQLMHLDIKPGNILYNAEGEPKLTDFGIAKLMTAPRNDAEGLMGTPFYIAPERVAEQRQDWRSDMYSLAATLYHAATGRVPFDAPTVEETVWAHVKSKLTPPRKIISDLSKDTSNAICKAMEKDPNNRFQSYDQFIMDLEASRSRLLVKRFRR
tara:strand:+ start:2715 stop:3677 length:963 start_codon:yes stop_codon:yes gene_type:complete